jgi:hypothetical protein
MPFRSVLFAIRGTLGKIRRKAVFGFPRNRLDAVLVVGLYQGFAGVGGCSGGAHFVEFQRKRNSSRNGFSAAEPSVRCNRHRR